MIPRDVADRLARHDRETAKTAGERYWRVDEVAAVFEVFENNFSLQDGPAAP